MIDEALFRVGVVVLGLVPVVLAVLALLMSPPETTVGAMTVQELVTILQALPEQNATVVIGEGVEKKTLG